MDHNRPSPNDIPENRQRTKDRATYLGTMDHPDNAKVRSAVGFVGDACWFIEGGNCWHRYPHRRVREAVRLIIAWIAITHPPTTFSQTAKGPKTAQRTLEQWTTPITPRYVPRSACWSAWVGLMEVVNAIGVLGWRPRPLHVPYGLRGYNE
jgi:hypothetical protein